MVIGKEVVGVWMRGLGFEGYGEGAEMGVLLGLTALDGTMSGMYP